MKTKSLFPPIAVTATPSSTNFSSIWTAAKRFENNKNPATSLTAGDLMWYWPEPEPEAQLVMVLKDWEAQPNKNGDVFPNEIIEILFGDSTIRVPVCDLYETKETCNLSFGYSGSDHLRGLRSAVNAIVQSTASDIVYNQDQELLTQMLKDSK